jgi:peroxiredoxin Q/BCP
MYLDVAEMQAGPSVSSVHSDPVAPPFTLLNQDGRTVDLQSLRGSWVVLYFFPEGDTPSCACHATAFTQLLTEFRSMNAKVLGINQGTPENHRLFREKYALELDLLSDPERDTMRSYGAYMDFNSGGLNVPAVLRTTFLIDPHGRIRCYWVDIMAEGHIEQVKNRLELLQRYDPDSF